MDIVFCVELPLVLLSTWLQNGQFIVSSLLLHATFLHHTLSLWLHVVLKVSCRLLWLWSWTLLLCFVCSSLRGAFGSKYWLSFYCNKPPSDIVLLMTSMFVCFPALVFCLWVQCCLLATLNIICWSFMLEHKCSTQTQLMFQSTTWTLACSILF